MRAVTAEAADAGVTDALRADAAALGARIEGLNAALREADARLR